MTGDTVPAEEPLARTDDAAAGTEQPPSPAAESAHRTNGQVAQEDASVRDLLADRRVLTDTVVPPLLFVGVDAWLGLRWAAGVSLALAATLVVYRLVRGHRLLYAVSGLGGAALGVGLALWTGSTGAYFVPGIVSNALVAVACVVSVLVRRPLIAVTAMAIYRWPWAWYRHDRVRPAYSEITWLWALFYAGKALLQAWLVQRDAVGALAAVRVASGYPAFAAMLLITYVYVEWRLRTLDAPPVEEFQAEEAT